MACFESQVHGVGSDDVSMMQDHIKYNFKQKCINGDMAPRWRLCEISTCGRFEKWHKLAITSFSLVKDCGKDGFWHMAMGPSCSWGGVDKQFRRDT